MEVKVEMKAISRILRDHGVTPDGEVQMQLTREIANRLPKYMPLNTSILQKSVRIAGPDRIEVNQPYAHYQWAGKVWVDPVYHCGGFMTPDGWRSRYHVKKVPTGRDLTYDKTKNPNAGPKWDERLMEQEGRDIGEMISQYANGSR